MLQYRSQQHYKLDRLLLYATKTFSDNDNMTVPFVAYARYHLIRDMDEMIVRPILDPLIHMMLITSGIQFSYKIFHSLAMEYNYLTTFFNSC